MAALRTRPASAQFSSMLQLVSSPGPSIPSQTDFRSMEDVHDLARLATSSSESISDTGHSLSSRNSASSTNHSFHSPLLRSTSFQSNAEFRSDPHIPPIPSYLPKRKEKRSGFRSNQSDVNSQQSSPTPFDLKHSAPQEASRKQKLPAVGVTLPASTSQTDSLPLSSDDSPFSSSPTTPCTPTFAPNKLRRSVRRADFHARRKSVDFGPGMMQAGILRLKRSPSMWTTHTGDRPMTSSAENPDRHAEDLWAEPQLTEQQKLIVLKRARKIAQVFGSEAPTDLIHSPDYPRRLSADHRNSLSTIISTDLRPSVDSTLRRSNSTSAAPISETKRRVSNKTSFNQAESSSRPPDTIAIESAEIPTPPSPTSAAAMFRERRRRAAKLTQFFGVNYQDISRSISETFVLPSAPQHDAPTVNAPVVEVDVKVSGRRFWGLADGEMKNAEVADVIGKLRGLKAA